MKLSPKLLVIPPIALGAAVFALVVLARDEPEHAGLRERASAVHTTTVTRRAIVPRAIGSGVVQPARTWRALAEVSGRIISVHPRLEVGELLQEGAEVLRIDPTEYELRVARLEADRQATEAEIDKLGVGVQNTKASLAVARASLELAEGELGRLESLAEQGTASSSTVDAQAQAVLRERSTVVELENSLNVAAADEKVFAARLASTQAQIDETRLLLERTVVAAPFDCRVGSVSVEEAQYVAAGTTMVEADDLAVAEIGVEFSIERARNLLGPEQRRQVELALAPEAVWDRLGLEASVKLRGADFEYHWPARFARVAGFLDATTRTVTMVAEVDDAYRGSAGNERPPLAKGMFVEVEFSGPQRDDRIVIPQSAVHDGHVYLVDDDSRLAIRPVEIELAQFDEAVVARGLESGDVLVLTDLVPAIPGMLLTPTEVER